MLAVYAVNMDHFLLINNFMTHIPQKKEKQAAETEGTEATYNGQSETLKSDYM